VIIRKKNKVTYISNKKTFQFGVSCILNLESVQTLNISSSVTAKVRSSFPDNWLISFWTSFVSIRIYRKKTKDEMRRGGTLTINHGLNRPQAHSVKTQWHFAIDTDCVENNNPPCWFPLSVFWCFRRFPGYVECMLTGLHLCSQSHIQQPGKRPMEIWDWW